MRCRVEKLFSTPLPRNVCVVAAVGEAMASNISGIEEFLLNQATPHILSDPRGTRCCRETEFALKTTSIATPPTLQNFPIQISASHVQKPMSYSSNPFPRNFCLWPKHGKTYFVRFGEHGCQHRVKSRKVKKQYFAAEYKNWDDSWRWGGGGERGKDTEVS